MDSDESDTEAENKRPNGQLQGRGEVNNAYALENAYAGK